MKLRVGVIGTGAIAKYRHLPEYAAREDVEIVALCDIIKKKLINWQLDTALKASTPTTNR